MISVHNMNIKITSTIVILLFIGLAIAPSIPAIQQKTIKDKAYDNLIEKLDGMRHPILYNIVLLISFSFISRGKFYTNLSEYFIEGDGYGGIAITNPILLFITLMRGCRFYISAAYWLVFWDSISEKNGWNWQI